MAIPFSRSMRSLYADTFRPSLMALIVAMVLLVAWAMWFFFAPMATYETGQIIGTTRNGIVIAEFSKDGSPRIRRGQSALLRPDGMLGGEVSGIPAIVTDISYPPGKDLIRVELYPRPDATSMGLLSDNFVGEVDIEVERVSPAILVVRGFGQSVDMPRVDRNPGK